MVQSDEEYMHVCFPGYWRRLSFHQSFVVCPQTPRTQIDFAGSAVNRYRSLVNIAEPPSPCAAFRVAHVVSRLS